MIAAQTRRCRVQQRCWILAEGRAPMRWHFWQNIPAFVRRCATVLTRWRSPGKSPRRTRRARRLSYLPLDFLKEDIPGAVRCDLVFECPPHLFAGAKSGGISARQSCVGAWRPTDYSGRVLARSRGTLSGRGELICRFHAALYRNRQYLFAGRNQRLAERGGVWFNQATEDEEGDGGLGGWDFGGCNLCKALQKARPPSTIRSKFKVPLIPLSASIVSVPPFPPRMLITVARSNANPTVP